VECCPTPLQWLCEVARYWRELEHAVVHVDPEHPKHAQYVTCQVSMQAMEELGHFQPQELCTDHCVMGLCIIMLKHEAMAVDEWHVNRSQDLVTLISVHSNRYR
jgi:diphthamide synthase (EF-2-diphthine--ammonia ligase)